MKTTVEISDDLYRLTKAEAALHRRTIKDLIEEGLRLVLEIRHTTSPASELARLIKHTRRTVDSELEALAANPKNPAGFGHDTRRR